MNVWPFDSSSQIRSAAGLRGALVLACIVFTFAMLLYLGEGLIVSLRFIVFVVGIFLPASSLFARMPGLGELDPAPRALIGAAVTMLCITPVFYIRRAIPIPLPAFDIVLA